MKIATNVHRDAFGGITISNLALFDWLEEAEDRDDSIVGMEYVSARHVQGALIFRRYEPAFFKHHIINAIDVFLRFPQHKHFFLRKRWHVLIETTKTILRQEKPDIILANGTYFAPWILTCAAKELGIPVVLRYAGILQKEISTMSFWARKRLLSHERMLVHMSDALIFPSDLCQKVVDIEIANLSGKQCSVIPNPVKTLQIKGRRAGRVGRRLVLAAIGRWVPVKNFAAFVEAHEYLLNEKFSHRAILVTSGQGGHRLIPETMEIQKPMDQKALWQFYQTVDLLIVPSHFETFCNVAAEAVVSGTPVLVSEHVGFSEILRKAGMERMIIPTFDDVDLVAEAIKKIAGTIVAKKERERVLALLSPHKVHKKILTVLEEVVSA